MTDKAKRCVEWLRTLEEGKGFASYLIGAPEQAKEAADLIESLSEQLEQVTRERDAAVKDIRNAALCGCHVCKHYYRPDQNVRKYACKIHGSFDEHDFIADDGSIFCGAMEWRGAEANQ